MLPTRVTASRLQSVVYRLSEQRLIRPASARAPPHCSLLSAGPCCRKIDWAQQSQPALRCAPQTKTLDRRQNEAAFAWSLVLHVPLFVTGRPGLWSVEIRSPLCNRLQPTSLSASQASCFSGQLRSTGPKSCRLGASSLVRSRALCSLPLEKLRGYARQQALRESLLFFPQQFQGPSFQYLPILLTDAKCRSAICRELFAMSSRRGDRFRALQEFPHLCFAEPGPCLTALSICQAP